ncbi:hypothetical protein FOZ60_006894 [Perkinsus olseni]|uniref:C2H2-type domain-containing protein n=1 Tax=Perkinsus olseni TaxID=32597 RepID=A0A7J6NMG0_PEROL|nr:hypothetical protein FOZ60_006894 [Perkinsus olseni]
MVAADRDRESDSEVEIITPPVRKRRRRNPAVVIDLVADCDAKDEDEKPELPVVHDWRGRRDRGLNLRGDHERNPNDGEGGEAAEHQAMAHAESESSDSESSEDIHSDWGTVDLPADEVVPDEHADLRRFRCHVRGCLKVFDTRQQRDEHVGLLHKESQEAFEIRSRVFAREKDRDGEIVMALADGVTRNRSAGWSFVRICAAFITALRVEQEVRGVPLRGMEQLVEAVYKAGAPARLEEGHENRHTSRKLLRGMFDRPPHFEKVDPTEGRAMVPLGRRVVSVVDGMVAASCSLEHWLANSEGSTGSAVRELVNSFHDEGDVSRFETGGNAWVGGVRCKLISLSVSYSSCPLAGCLMWSK